MEPRHAPLKTAPRRARKKRRVMKKEVASSSTTPSSVSVAAASDGEQPPLLVPVPAGAEAFEYERGKKDIFPKPGELVQVRRKDIWRCVWQIDWVAVVAVVVVVVAVYGCCCCCCRCRVRRLSGQASGRLQQ